MEQIEIVLKSKKKLKLKDATIDERDEMLDAVSYDYKDDGEIAGVKMMHSTMTKWIRIGVDGDTSDKFLKTLTLEDKMEVFTKMQSIYLVGEGKASK